MDAITVRSLRKHCDRAEDAKADPDKRRESIQIVIDTVRKATNGKLQNNQADLVNIPASMVDDYLIMAAKKISMLVFGENFEAARRLIDDTELQQKSTRGTKEKNRPVSDIGLAANFVNRLEEHGIMTAMDLSEYPCELFNSWRNTGDRFLEEISLALKRCGLPMNQAKCKKVVP